MNQQATLNDTVTVHYTARTREGGVIEDTVKRKPLTLNLNNQDYAQPLRTNIVSMQIGDQKVVTVNPDQQFGYRDPNCQISVPLSGLPAGVREGDQLSVKIQNEEIDVWVIQILADEAVLDASHPLAGETIEYTIQLVSIETP
ncbi:MAG: FKBP-type peptidyl-prolyl cis-trans isomerase [Planctomycetaceae bacterium]|nr:FKBP-type peptidyl-prolyl cis-trans isomerase [Planctomycetaceae bacterium]